MFVELARRAYQQPRSEEAARLDARLRRAASGSNAAGDAARSMRRRGRAAEKAIATALEHVLNAPENPSGVLSPIELSAAYDEIIAGDTAACLNAVASVAARFPNPEKTMKTADATMSWSVTAARRHALTYLEASQKELVEARRDRGRPVPMRLAKRGVGLLLSGGVLFRGYEFVSTHWPQIAAHLPH